MSILRGRGYKPHVTERFVRVRIRPVGSFKPSSFRTLDIGKPERHKLIRGQLKRDGWKTQSVLIEKKVFPTKHTIPIIEKAKQY